ncbi:LabA-like NYN domain-containing protein [Flavobacterium sp.]|uniref:LabA-like NYN domain-containing protein n=1 Tax=Flavobacterium sp. TaxID=239 RepID=UPI004033D1B8
MNNPPRIAVFIDASNLWEAQKTKGRFFDFEKLRAFIRTTYTAQSIEVFYYTAYPANGTRDYSLDGKHKFFTYLSKALGFIIRKKQLKRITVQTDMGAVIQEKGNMDVEMAIDILHHLNTYDIAVLFSGDSDFLALVSYLRNRGKKVYIYSSKNNISEELRTGADGYTDVLKIKEDIWRGEIIRQSQNAA